MEIYLWLWAASNEKKHNIRKMGRTWTEITKKNQKITNISKQLDERESTKTRYIPLSFKYIGNPGPLNVDLGN